MQVKVGTVSSPPVIERLKIRNSEDEEKKRGMRRRRRKPAEAFRDWIEHEEHWDS